MLRILANLVALPWNNEGGFECVLLLKVSSHSYFFFSIPFSSDDFPVLNTIESKPTGYERLHSKLFRCLLKNMKIKNVSISKYICNKKSRDKKC